MDVNALVPLPWDSEFLGYPVFRSTAGQLAGPALGALLADTRAQGGRLLYLFVDPADAVTNEAATAAGLRLVDRKVTYAMPATVPEEPLQVVALRPADRPTPALEALALQSGEYSRFRLDPNFPPHVYETLYRRWLHNSFGQGMGQHVLVVQEELTAEPQGLLTLGIKGERADIGLLAVDSAARGRRLGQQLVLAARHQTVWWGLPTLQVVTQGGNLAACRFYERCGFTVDHSVHIYHAWL